MATQKNAFDRFARLYDWEHDQYLVDVDVYLGLARRFGGPILELACGSGRLLAPLAAAGFAVTGVDSSGPMLERARSRLDHLGLTATLTQQRLERLQLDGTFRTIIVGLDSFGLLIKRSDQLDALRAARQHATHDGRLVLDLANGNLRGAVEPAEELVHDLTQPDSDTGRPITKFVLRRPRPADQLDDLMFFYDEQDERGYLKRSMVELKLRWFTRFELELLLQSAGWQVDEVYGDYDLSPFGSESTRLIVVAR
ncbi:MAG: class I SAM-dependent methyltransferase [Chloroflexi bacterium]|nr:class I SAM-dependent methyltransferase [Chloroflexota bacterium]MBV9131540.1 class I SAM-dependent methyltransferase [Chloroflexota bacterium]MBV9893632.1 class I SAM-dependent methyltransferase [Chloroflexota bacterium]